jgi:hypothetical protein
MASYFKEEHMTGIERITAERKRQIEEQLERLEKIVLRQGELIFNLAYLLRCKNEIFSSKIESVFSGPEKRKGFHLCSPVGMDYKAAKKYCQKLFLFHYVRYVR